MEKILELYRKNYPLYNEFTNTMQQLIDTRLSEKEVRVHLIISRVKTEASLTNKITRKRYTDIAQITDLCGIRIITYFAEDVDRVAAVLRASLLIDPAASVDKRRQLAPTQFGYGAVHLVAGLSGTEKFKNCKIEIQICSILQHAWAEIEHDLGYKAPRAIPYEARRSFSRVAGLLELADLEFTRLREELKPAALPTPEPAALPAGYNRRRQLDEQGFSRRLAGKIALAGWTAAERLRPGCAAKLKIVSACAAMSFLAMHLAAISHKLMPVLTALMSKEATLLSLVGNHMHV